MQNLDLYFFFLPYLTFYFLKVKHNIFISDIDFESQLKEAKCQLLVLDK